MVWLKQAASAEEGLTLRVAVMRRGGSLIRIVTRRYAQTKTVVAEMNIRAITAPFEREIAVLRRTRRRNQNSLCRALTEKARKKRAQASKYTN